MERRAASGPTIDVLAFPPEQAELQSWQARDEKRWSELERRARIALFFGIGMFLVWAADVGAAFEIDHSGSTVFGVASVPIALTVVAAHLLAQWALERSRQGLAGVARNYADVTLAEAAPLLAFAQNDAAVAQYLRCVGRQRRALRRLEKGALYAWMKRGGRTAR